MERKAVAEWQSILRDIAITVVGSFMLIFDTAFATPNALVLGAGASLLSLPAALRVDAARRLRKQLSGPPAPEENDPG